MSSMPREIPERRTAFVKNYGRRSMRSLRAPEPGPAMAAALDATSSRDTPSVWCTSFAVMASRSLRWPTVGAARRRRSGPLRQQRCRERGGLKRDVRVAHG
jgi:hypothetical protein